jgi:nucleoside-diphosphate-sugar epimerase
VVTEALARGWEVTALHRGRTGEVPADATTLHADRTDDAVLASALGTATWDLVVDTWSGAPAVAGLAARALAGRAGRFGYVSSMSVYVWGSHTNESSPVVDGDPAATDGDYAAVKRGAELAVLDAFPDALLARAGLILGPHEDIGRLPWWLGRIERGGDVLAPGRPDRPLQYVDARDLASWMLDALIAGHAGPVDVISPPGHATTRTLLESCIAATGSDARLVWVPEGVIAEAGVEPWTQLPCWVPESGEFAGFLESDTSHAVDLGLTCRPITATVTDTWKWMRSAPMPEQRPDRPVHGIPAELEQEVLAAVR